MITADMVDDLQTLADFDHPFQVLEDGALWDGLAGIYAPEVYHDPNADIEILSDKWEALTGFTGQFSYNGAVMHPSEYLGGGLAAHILSTPGVYVVTSVEVYPEDDGDGNESPEPAGWVVLKAIV